VELFLIVAAIGAVLGLIKALDRKVPGSLYKFVLVVWAVGPLLGTIYAMVRLWQDWISWTELSLFVFFYLATGMGITGGFHRLLTHKSFDTHPAVRFTFLAFGCMALQGRPIDWAADHLKHHAFSDKAGDPHSPLEGFWHAHMGWFFREPAEDRYRYAGPLMKDPLVRFMDRTFLVWVAVGLLIPYLIAGWPGLIWGGLVRIAFVNHATFAVNSICHTFGARPFDTKDESRNNWIVAMLTFGEGWHNNHHAFPAMAYHGMSWKQFDPTAVLIKTLVFLRLAKNPKLPRPELISRRRGGKVAAQTAASAGD
jgi:stearoyl-CoA desaturase (delta-9 desaturase)